MKWNSNFAIGIEAIDTQHKKIFEHLLAIENSAVKRDPWHVLHFLLAQLTEYMKFHFAVEEALLEIARYPDRADHGESHTRLIGQLGELETRLRKSASDEDLVAFFESWFVGHVLSSDRKYAAYLKDELPVLFGKPPG